MSNRFKFYHIAVIFSGIATSMLNAIAGEYYNSVWPILTAAWCIMHACK